MRSIKKCYETVADKISELPFCAVDMEEVIDEGINYLIVMRTNSFYTISVLARVFDERYLPTYHKWSLKIETVDTDISPKFVLTLTQEERKVTDDDVETICETIDKWSADEYKKYFEYHKAPDLLEKISPKIYSWLLRGKISDEIERLGIKNKVKIATIIVGENTASKVYVRNKENACNEVGIVPLVDRLPADVDEDTIIDRIHKYNEDDSVTGILVQLPLPVGLDEDKIINEINPDKDLDGFTNASMSKLWTKKWTVRGEKWSPFGKWDELNSYAPCTPLGIFALLSRINYNVDGKNAVVVGRSDIVGKPIAKMLMDNNATVSVCHSHTSNLNEIVKNADLVIAAVGSPKLIKENMVKKGAVVIDVGINRVDGKLCGDVDYDNLKEKCSYITPVPGGIGPMTVTSLLLKALVLYKKKIIYNG